MSALLALVLAHGSLDEQLALLDRLVEASPGNARHRLRRGELRRLHGEEHRAQEEVARRDAELAEADFARALELEPGFLAVRLARGRLRVSAGRAAEALDDLEAFVAADPGHADGHLWRARALASLGRAEAVAAFTRAIERAASPGPELYLERAAADRGEGALAGLEEGLARLGPLAALDLAALDLELGLGRPAAALARVERRLALPGRREEWLLRRAELLKTLGRAPEARASAEAGLEAVASLPPARRHAPATADVERRLRALAK